MVFQYVIDQKFETVFANHSGDVKINEMSTLYREILASPDFFPGMSFCRDTRGAKLPDEWSYGFFSGPIRTEVNNLLIQLGECRQAWIVDGGKQFAIAHQFLRSNRLTHSGMIDRKNFIDERLACDWLGLPEKFEIPFP